jgi:probable rRNA maturation factor
VHVSVTSHRDPEPLDLSAFESLGSFVMRMEDAPEQSELSVALVSEGEIADLNVKYRGIEGPTDVLAFGCDDPCPADGEEPIALGDVVIAPEVAEAQAAERGETVEAELNLLLVHGTLHLFGYGHDTQEEADAMEARERALLEAFGELG